MSSERVGTTTKATELTWLERCGVEQYAIYRRSLRFPALAWQVLPVAARRSLLVHHVQGMELEAMAVIEPGAGEVKEAQAGASGECEGIHHELGDRPLADGTRFVVQDVDAAVGVSTVGKKETLPLPDRDSTPPSCVAFSGALWMLAAMVWYSSAELYGGVP